LEQRLLQSNLKALPEVVPQIEAAESTVQELAPQSERAAAETAQQMSPRMALKQLGARALRYGPALAGGYIGHKLMGPIGGAATGLVLRPMMHSMLRLARHPAVARPLALTGQKIAQGAEALLGAATHSPASAAGPAELQLVPQLTRPEMVPGLAGEDDSLDAAIATALAKAKGAQARAP
jgi:hypothetical protein